MANQFYPKGKQAILDGTVNVTTDNIKAILLTSTHTFNSAHDNLDDITNDARRIQISGNLGTKTATDGTFDAADTTLTAVTSGKTIASIVLYKDTGTESTSRLLCMIDTNAAAGAISVPTNGGDIVLQWNGSGIFTI